MKNTADANIFVYSTLSEACAKKTNELIEKPHSNIILRSIKDECEPKLLEIFKTFTILGLESKNSSDLGKLIHSDVYNTFQQKYPQLFEILKTAFEKNYFARDSKKDEFLEFCEQIKEDISKILKMMSFDKILFPTTQENYEKISDAQEYIDIISKLSFIRNPHDSKHLALSHMFIQQTQHKLNFLTLDEKHIIKNKEKIEKCISDLIITRIPDFNPEKFALK